MSDSQLNSFVCDVTEDDLFESEDSAVPSTSNSGSKHLHLFKQFGEESLSSHKSAERNV